MEKTTKVKKYMSGNDAVALAAIHSGVCVITGYPGTPSSEAIGNLWHRKSDYPDIEIQWSTNEKVALEIACAAAWANKAALCTMKMSGLNVAYDSLISFVYSGCTGAMVLYVCDDPGVSAGMPEQDVRGFAKMSDMPVLEPATVQESYDLTKYAFELSHKIQMPVMVRSVTNVALSHAPIMIDSEPNPIKELTGEAKFELDIQKYTKAGAKICMTQHADLIKRCELAQEIIKNDGINKLKLGAKDGLGIVAAGVSSTYIDEAFELAASLGVKITDPTVFDVKTSVPLPSHELLKMLEHCSKILVVEENEPYVEDGLHILGYRSNSKAQVFGKHDKTLSRIGNFTAKTVCDALLKITDNAHLIQQEDSSYEAQCAARPIGVCAGCPHRGVYISINRAIRKAGFKKNEVIVTGDIGCTILGMSPPFNTLWTEVSMGASIPMAQGFEYAGIKTPLIATIGDSTFLHAGIPGLINAVQNNSNITVIIMDNGWTAMTGMQVNAGTDKSFQQDDKKNVVDIAKIIPALNIEDFTIIDPYDLEAMTDAVQKAMAHKGVSVILARRECAIQAGRRKLRYGNYQVDKDPCTRCKVCIMTTGCPALVFEGNDVFINTSQCNGCGICSKVCPTGAIK